MFYVIRPAYSCCHFYQRGVSPLFDSHYSSRFSHQKEKDTVLFLGSYGSTIYIGRGSKFYRRRFQFLVCFLSNTIWCCSLRSRFVFSHQTIKKPAGAGFDLTHKPLFGKRNRNPKCIPTHMEMDTAANFFKGH